MRATLVLFLLLTGAANAADIEIIVPEKDPAPAYIGVNGRIEKLDGAKFVEITKDIRRGVVYLAGPGGNLNPALMIGLAMRRKGFTARILEGSICVSACAYAWLGGAERIVHRNARIGFHSSKNPKSWERSEAGNALIKRYMQALGYSDATYEYVVSADPKSVTWLTESDANVYGMLPTPQGYPPHVPHDPH